MRRMVLSIDPGQCFLLVPASFFGPPRPCPMSQLLDCPTSAAGAQRIAALVRASDFCIMMYFEGHSGPGTLP